VFLSDTMEHFQFTFGTVVNNDASQNRVTLVKSASLLESCLLASVGLDTIAPGKL